MAVEYIEEYRQKNGENILKAILRPTKRFPDGGCFYADISDKELVNGYTWYFLKQKEPYIITATCDKCELYFHREKAFDILSYYPDYIKHINGVGFDNVNANLDVVNQQQNCWSKLSRGYNMGGKSFRSHVRVNQQDKYAPCVQSEVEAAQLAYQLEIQYEDYRYDFPKDRRNDLDILDMERTGLISEDEAAYRHVLRHAADNAWYYYRYNLADYFKDNHIPVPAYSLDSDGFMTHPITGQKLCPM